MRYPSPKRRYARRGSLSPWPTASPGEGKVAGARPCRSLAIILGALAIFGLSLLPPGFPLRDHSLEAATKQLAGEHTITYDIINPLGVLFLPDYSIDGFSQKVIAQDEYSRRIVVSANLSPFSSHAPFPIPPGSLSGLDPRYLKSEKARQSGDPEILSLARSIAKGADQEAEAVERVMNWIADHLSYDYSLQLPADALSALRQRKASCVGYTNLAISLLRSLGVPSRGAHGYLPPGYDWGITKEYWGRKINGGGFHAWMEVFYPDAGWVFYDPANSIHFVDPFHILLWVEGGETKHWGKEKGFIDVDRATTFTIIGEVNHAEAVDEIGSPSKDILGRRWVGRPVKASLSGTVRDGERRPIEEGRAILWRGDHGKIYPLQQGGGFSILGLEQGSHAISIRARGFSEGQWTGTLQEGERKIIELVLEAGGEVGGKVTDREGRPISQGKVFYWVEGKGLGVPLRKDGTYLLEGLRTGRYKISVRADGFPETFQEASVLPGRVVELNFVLSP